MTDTAESFKPDDKTNTLYDRLFEEVYRPLFPGVQPAATPGPAASGADVARAPATNPAATAGCPAVAAANHRGGRPPCGGRR